LKLVNKDIWESKDSVIAVTTNSFIKKSGDLVMGRGAAYEAMQRFPWLPKIAGDQILKHYKHLGVYHWMVLGPMGNAQDRSIGLFQVKYHFRDAASLQLIKESVDKLNEWVRISDRTVSLNFPGIGNGGLSIDTVLPVVSNLDERVTVYKWP